MRASFTLFHFHNHPFAPQAVFEMIPHCEAIIPKIMLKNNGLLKEKAEKQYATASAFCYSNHNS